MNEPGVAKKKWKVWMDVPEELQAVLKKKMKKIGLDCLKQNAEIVLDLFQDMIIKHVLKMQIHDKTLSKIIRGNPEFEDKSDVPPDIEPIAGKIAKSSMLGQDPWGDEELPKKTPKEGDTEAEHSSAYSSEQALLKSIQDNTWSYLTTHLRRILHEDILLHVVDEEMKYAADEDKIRSQTARKRMPWKVYRAVVTELLPESTGLFELLMLMALCRESGDSAARWLQRLGIGKTLVEQMDVKLPEKLYIDLATRFLTPHEIKTMAVDIVHGTDAKKLTPVQAKRAISRLSWDKLGQLVKSSLHSGGPRYRQSIHRHLCDTRLFTLDQARRYLDVYKPQRATAPTSRSSGERRRNKTPICRKCTEAGLTGIYVRHKTEKCVDRIRAMNLKKFKDNNSRKRGRERSTNFQGSRKPKTMKFQNSQLASQAEDECKTCKDAERPYRHKSKTCKFAPGGPWHGKEGEELRALQRKFYENKKRSRASRNQTNSAFQDAPLCKRTRGEEESPKKSTDENPPLWKRQISMIGVQDCGPSTSMLDLPSKTNLGGVRSTPGVKSGLNCAFAEENELRVTAKLGELGIEDEKVATLVSKNLVANPETAIVPWNSQQNELQKQEDTGMKIEESASCVCFGCDKYSKPKFEFCHMPNYALMSDAEKREWLGEGMDCFYPRPNGKCHISYWRQLSMLQTPLSSPPGGSANPIDLTKRDMEKLDLGPTKETCYMATGDEFDSSDSETPEEFPQDDVVYVSISACGPDGVPYGRGTGACYWWAIDQAAWLFLNTLRQDFPIWGEHWKIMMANGKTLRLTDKPRKLGLKTGEHVHARLLLLHMPNASSGYTFSMPVDTAKKSGQEVAEMQVHEAAMAAAVTRKEEAKRNKRKRRKVYTDAMSAAADATQVIVLEIWVGRSKYLSVRWGKSDPLRCLLGALAAVRARPGHHPILLTTAHRIAGKGCVRAIDTPVGLALPRGGTLSMHYVPNRPDTSPPFIPTRTVAWQILKTKGVHMWDKTKSRRRSRGGVRSRGSRKGRKFRPKDYKNNNLSLSLYNETYWKISSVLLNQYTRARKVGRKSRIPQRVAGSSTAYCPENEFSSKRKISRSSKSRKKRRRSKDQKSCVDMKIVPQDITSLENTGELCTSSEVTSHVGSDLNLTFEPEHSGREISPVYKRTTGRNTLNVSKTTKFPSPRSKSVQKPINRENPDFLTKAPKSPKNAVRRSDVSLLLGSDSSTSTTMKSEDVTKTSNMSGESDGSETSETVYKPLYRTVTRGKRCLTRNIPNTIVQSPVMKFPFRQDSLSELQIRFEESPLKTPMRAESGSITCKGSVATTDLYISRVSETPNTEDKDGENSPSERKSDEKQSKDVTFVTNSTPTKRKRSKSKSREEKKGKPRFSETKNYRLLRTYLKVLDQDGITRRIQVALDTQSNVSYAKEHLGIPRSWRGHESKYVKGIGGYAKGSVPLTARILKEGQIIEIDVRSPSKTMFNSEDGPSMLLSAQHCVLLKIDINKALTNLKHGDTPFLKPKRRKINPRYESQQCYIAEKLMKQYLEKTGGSDREPKQCSIDDVEIAGDFTPEQVRLVKSICQKYRSVFASSPDEIPPPLKDAKPHVFKMKAECKPLYCKRPNWGPCQRKYLEQWTRKAIEQGLMEPAPDSEWASRPVLVGKYRGNTSKRDVPDGIRTCVDFTRVNDFIVKQPPQYTDPFEEIRRASGHKYYFEADGQKQFNSIPLAEESRDITTTWTPLGLMRWLRLIMGTKDASGRAQMEYSAAMTRYLSDEARAHLANFQDDFLGFHNTIPGLTRTYESFLRMCDKAGITLNPAKIRIGVRKCKFYGFNLSKKGMEPSEKNLDPVRKMTVPKNRSEVRSVLGIFNQFRHFFVRYDRLVLFIQKLLRKNEPFVWAKEAQTGYDHVREKLLSGTLYLASPDNTLPLILETDGSDDGWGAILLQIIDGKRRVIKMWSKQWKTLHMRRAPPYYKETKAWMNGLENARIYADYSSFPIQCITDHIPLTYVKNTSGKGPVSQFILDNLSSLDYTITYRPGGKLVEADAVSRFPCIGPKTLATDGVIEAFNILLDALPRDWTTKGKVWVYAQSETAIIQQEVRQWMSILPKTNPARKVPIMDSPTADKITSFDYSLGLWVPEADKVKMVVNKALDRKRPFACLVPSCLVHRIPEGPEHQKTITTAKKIVFLQPEMTWIIYKIDSISDHQVYAINDSDPTECSFGTLNDFRGIVRGSPEWDFKEWVPLQESMIQENPKMYPKEKISTRQSDGFKLYIPDTDKTLALVPQKYVRELVEWQHRKLCHGYYSKVYQALKRHWHWPEMKKDVRNIVTACAPCQLLKAKRARAHRHFRAKVFCTPRTSWGMDFYGVATSKRGYNNILGGIDLATAEARLFACKERTAPVVTDCTLYGIFLRDGCPLHIHSDAAREFISKAMQRLCQIVGCQQTTTLAHHPTGNSTIERLWQWVGACLRIMTKEQYLEWEKYVRLMEHTWNTSYHSVLRSTPFEAAHGLKARSAIDSLTRASANVDTDLMTTDGIEAMRATARAFEQQIQNVRQEAAAANAELLRKGSKKAFKVGEEVTFYLPPTEQEALSMGRKPKHLLQYRGPAFVTERLSGTTYRIEFEGRKYNRCFSELRPYKSDKLPLDLPIATHEDMQERKLIVGNYVALCDSADPKDDHFHLCRVLEIEDATAILLNYATFSANIHTAKFSVMYQERHSARYTTDKPRINARSQEVIDRVSLQEAEDYVDHYNIKMTPKMRIKAKCIRQLQKLGLKHHILGKTFP